MAGISKAEREARAAAAAAAEQGGEQLQGSTGVTGGESSTSQAGADEAAALQAQAQAEAEAKARAKARAEAEAEALSQVRTEELAKLSAAIAELPGDYTDADFVVSGMRSYFAEVFTDEHEAQIRAVVVAPAAAPQLVPMVRSASHYPAPHTADVHPDEVANFAAGGWTPA